MQALPLSKVAAPKTLVVIESSRHERIDDQYEDFLLLDRREFGDKRASIFRKEG
jgi:16S rRNA G966 N2-methylase RsmD